MVVKCSTCSVSPFDFLLQDIHLSPPKRNDTEPVKMLQIHCEGTPHEVGLKHGQDAKAPISRTIDFYTAKFKEDAKLDWPKVQSLAMEFEPTIRKKWPAYLEEMTGVAQGAQVPLADILAINVRTEIAFGLFSDGCTALSWQTAAGSSWLAQNWDWQEAQKPNIVHLTITQPTKPTIKMITEAGLIGKIGLNSQGVGVCLNAIRAKGMDPTRLPCHLALRMVLESSSRGEALQKLEKHGVASACHMLVADAATGGTGLECSSFSLHRLPPNAAGQVFHSNHYLCPPAGVDEDAGWLRDSKFRVQRIEELCERIPAQQVTKEALYEVFCDRKNAPGAICRSQEGVSGSATLFNIIMDLGARRAEVVVGKPTEVEERLVLAF